MCSVCQRESPFCLHVHTVSFICSSSCCLGLSDGLIFVPEIRTGRKWLIRHRVGARVHQHLQNGEFCRAPCKVLHQLLSPKEVEIGKTNYTIRLCNLALRQETSKLVTGNTSRVLQEEGPPWEHLHGDKVDSLMSYQSDFMVNLCLYIPMVISCANKSNFHEFLIKKSRFL